jgi:hypothetical protein
VRGSDLQQEEGALEVQQADDSCDDDGCQGVERQVLEDRRQAQQHKAYQSCIHKARRACPNATTIGETSSQYAMNIWAEASLAQDFRRFSSQYTL